MRIAILTVWPYPHTGGIATHIGYLVQVLEQRGHAVRVVSGVGRPRTGTAIEIREEELREYALRAETRAHDADVLLAQDALSAVAVRDLLDWGEAPLVLTVHGYLAAEAAAAGLCAEGDRLHRYLLDLEREAYTGADRILAVDTRLAKHVEKLSGRRGRILPNAVDTEALRPVSSARREELRRRFGMERPTLVAARRLTAKNGVRAAVEALARIPEGRRPDLVLAGDGEDRGALETLVRSLGLEERVALPGAIPREEILDLYRAADLALVPSVPVAGVEEATSLAALEAMALGVPVVASDVGGLRELDGIRKVPAGDPEALAAAIAELLGNEKERRALGEAGRRAALRHGLGPWAEAYLEEVEEARKAHRIANLPDKPPAVPDGKLRVAFWVAHGNLTGGARVFFERLEAMRRRGHDAWAVAPVPKPAWLDDDVSWIVAPNPEPFLKAADVTVAMLWPQAEALAKAGVPALHFEQGNEWLFEPWRLPASQARAMRQAYGSGVVHAAVSPFARDVLEKRFGVQARMTPVAVDTRLFRPDRRSEREEGEDPRPVVLMVADDGLPFKGVDLVVEASDRLRRMGIEHRLVQVAPTPVYRIRGERTRIVNPSRERLAELYASADVFVSASSYEAFGLPPLEAMACGTAVVATDSGGIRAYARDGVNCLLVERTVEAIAEGIAKVLGDPDLRERLGREGRKTAEALAAQVAAADAAFEEALRLAAASREGRRPEPLPPEAVAEAVRSGAVDLAVRLVTGRQDGDAYDATAALLYRSGKREEAIRVLQRALRVTGTPDNQLNLAMLMAEQAAE
ncbi:MAG: glycosyltransferase family 4 protein [Bacillota bacterium]|nr:glycosyltransferase family 4 protein [Bacillota bacterium]